MPAEVDIEALRKMIGVSAAAAQLSSQGVRTRGLRQRAEARCLRLGASTRPSAEAVGRLLDEHRADAALGRGTYGCVFRGAWRGRPVALKFVACVPSSLRSLGSPLHEYRLNQAFAEHDLAWAPLGLSNRRAATGRNLASDPERAVSANVAVLRLKLLAGTLDKAVASDPELRRPELGRALLSLVRTAYERGLVHGDAKANNVGVERSGGGALVDLRFIDFGRSLSLRELALRSGREVASEVLRLCAAGDALRLAQSCRSLLERTGAGDAEGIPRPLEDFAASLLRSGEEADAQALRRRARTLLLSDGVRLRRLRELEDREGGRRLPEGRVRAGT